MNQLIYTFNAYCQQLCRDLYIKRKYADRLNPPRLFKNFLRLFKNFLRLFKKPTKTYKILYKRKFELKFERELGSYWRGF